jgi:ubiquinone/menaquinone biosynthesis C-methylase UbiE
MNNHPGDQNNMANVKEQNAVLGTNGIVLHRALGYDIFVWLISLGRERGYREKALDFANLKPGESVLDIGCGTGTLAITAKRRVGPAGRVFGIDASPEMLARAAKKARKAEVEVVFKNGIVEALPFPDCQFDVVLSTVMLHHLGSKARQLCAREIRRVLKPGGRVLVIDFAKPAEEKKGLLDHFHHHGYINLDDLVALLSEAGLHTVQSGAVGIGNLQFVLASAWSLSPANGESKV